MRCSLTNSQIKKSTNLFSKLKHFMVNPSMSIIVYVVRFSELCQDERVEPEKPIFLVAICNCKLTTDDPQLARLDIHLYSQMGTLDIIDVTSVLALVGRLGVKSQVSGGAWAIVDRSGTLAHAIYI